MIWKNNHNLFSFLIFVLFVNLSNAGTNCPKKCACALLTVVCTGQSLDFVPDDIPFGTIRLDLQQNRITEIKRINFVNLTSLKYLDLSNNGLEKIEEDAFADLINLERIRLNKNKLRILPEHLFHRMERLHRLDLSENELEIITNAHLIGSSVMKNLQLDKNKLTCIEIDVIKEWHTLEIFTLNSNRLTTLDELNELHNLRIFRIFDNPWLCDCRMQWVSQVFNSSLVMNAKCHRPLMLQGRNLLQIDQNEMKCSGIEKRSNNGGCADKKRCPAECACTATIIDCHDRSLTEIPTNLPNRIEEIRLNGNRIRSIPSKAFHNLHKLRTLDLSRNQINEIAADAFDGLTTLQHLHLFHNNITQLDSSTFHGLSELEMLMLNANNLGCLPKDLFRDLQNLHMLSIYKNKIQSIENGTLDSLKSIKAIHLSENPYICDCNLAWLADYLRKARLLDTSGVKCVFPRRMSGLFLSSTDSDKFKCKGSEYLTTKNAGQCLIDHPCPSQCVCFGTVVDCSNRGLYAIPEKLPKFTITLLLNKNKLVTIPIDGLKRMINLEKIDLSDNNITTIEKGAFSGLSMLKELVLNNNHLTLFDSNFIGLNGNNLERLHLNENQLECISAHVFSNLKNLTLLSLAKNHLKAIDPQALSSLMKLKSLYIAKNDWTCDCELNRQLNMAMALPFAQIVDSPKCVDKHEKEHLIVEIMQKMMNQCSAVKVDPIKQTCTTNGGYCPTECICDGTVVRCSNAGLTQIPRSLPKGTTELYLNGNELSELDDEDLSKLTELVRLDLSKNNLRVLNAFSFQKLHKLEVLILAFNKLQCLDDLSFYGLNSLRILSLHGNNLSQLSEQAFTNLTKNLQQIAALNNPFYCDCQMAWFHRWIRDSYVESGLSKCSAPSSMAGQVILTAPPSSFICRSNESIPRDVLSKCNPCIDLPCKNGGTCKRGTQKSYECKCSEGFYGEHCERSIDACYGNPCANDGQCQVIEEGRFKCLCKKGFIGSHCETNIDDCVTHKCQNNGTCVDEINDYHCNCPPMYAGKFCEDKIEVCSHHFNPCKNNAKCESHGNNLYTCHCKSGFTGQNCSTQIDNCLPNSCNNNGICKSNENGFECQCASGFVGEFCQSPLLPSMLYYRSEATCNKDNCVHGTCLRVDEDEPKCACHFGFTGKDCSIQSTIGFEEDGGYVAISSSEKNSSTGIESFSFTIRTISSFGILFYYGDETQFVAAELYDGRIRIALSVGRNDPSLMYSYYKVNNGQTHRIRFELKNNEATLIMDERLPQTIINKGKTKKMDIKSKQMIYMAGIPTDKLKKAARTYRIINAKSFVGCFSNVTIGGIDVNFDDDSIVMKHKTVASGCGNSVSLCNNVTCNNSGQCLENSTVSEGYFCHCNISYTGKNCENRVPMCNKERFRKHYEESGCRSLEPIKNANCVGWCGNDQTPFILNPDGSAIGKNCCCKAVKIRQRKVRMICPDGSKKTSIVQIIRKCQCTMCST